MSDNNLTLLTSGQSDWDTDIDANFAVLERGYHISERAGQAISSGQVLSLNSLGFFAPYDWTGALTPMAYSYTAAASGDSLQALAWGIVRSLDINSPAVAGQLAYATGSGFLTTVASGLPVGRFTTGRGILFQPALNAGGGGGGGYTPSYFVSSSAINAVVGSLHTFTMSLGGLHGWNRRVRLNSNSAAHVELKFYADAGHSDLQYSTLSGGISGVGSFNDRAGFPWDTNSGTLYGTVQVLSGDVSSASINVNASWQV